MLPEEQVAEECKRKWKVPNVFYFIVSSQRVVVTRPLPRDEGMAENHGVPEAGQFPKAWTRGRRETKSERRKESVAAHCRIR